MLGGPLTKRTPRTAKKKARLGGYEKHCPGLMAKGARWATEIILNERGLR